MSWDSWQTCGGRRKEAAETGMSDTERGTGRLTFIYKLAAGTEAAISNSTPGKQRAELSPHCRRRGWRSSLRPESQVLDATMCAARGKVDRRRGGHGSGRKGALESHQFQASLM